MMWWPKRGALAAMTASVLLEQATVIVRMMAYTPRIKRPATAVSQTATAPRMAPPPRRVVRFLARLLPPRWVAPSLVHEPVADVSASRLAAAA